MYVSYSETANIKTHNVTICKFVIKRWGASNPHQGLFTLIVAAVKALLVVECTLLSCDKAEKCMIWGVADGTVKTISPGAG